MVESGVPRHQARDARFPPSLTWAGVGVVGALVIAIAAASSPTTGIATTVLFAAAVAVVRRPITLLSILAVSIFVEVVRVGGTSITRVLAPLALLTVTLELVRGRAVFRGQVALFWAAAYGTWALASGIWTVSVTGTTYFLTSLAIGLVYTLAFATMLDSRVDLERLLYILGVASVVLGGISWLAFAGVIHLGGATQLGRAQGEVGDPSYFAAYQLLVLPLMLVLAGRAEKRWLRWALLVAILVIIGSVLVSLSRGALIALAILLLLLIVLPARHLFSSPRRKAVALLLVAFATMGVSVFYHHQLEHRVQTIFGKGPAGQQRGSGRLNLWLAARTTINEHPYVGIGYGAFPYVSNDTMLRTRGVDLEGYRFRYPGQPVHNSYLESWAELGVFGLILYVGLLTSTALSLRRTAIKAASLGDHFIAQVSNALLLGLITWSVTSFFLSTETSRAFWIVLGLALALPRLLPSEQPAGELRTP